MRHHVSEVEAPLSGALRLVLLDRWMALVVAAVLIVRADIDVALTAIAATLLDGGFLLGVVMAAALPRLLGSPPWTVDKTDASFVVRDHNGQALACVCFEQETRQPADSLLTRDEARRIAAKIEKQPRLARRVSASA